MGFKIISPIKSPVVDGIFPVLLREGGDMVVYPKAVTPV